MRKILSTTVVLLGLSQGANASVVYSFAEVDGNVVGTLSGFLNTDFPPLILGNLPEGLLPGIAAQTGSLLSGGDLRPVPLIREDSGDEFGLEFEMFRLTSWQAFGPGVGSPLVEADSSTGSLFLVGPITSDSVTGPIIGAGVGLSPEYVSGAPLSGGMTFLGATFASLGITTGDYNFTLDVVDVVESPGGSSLQDIPSGYGVTLSFGEAVAAVPVPATLPLLLAGLGIMGWRAGRKSTA